LINILPIHYNTSQQHIHLFLGEFTFYMNRFYSLWVLIVTLSLVLTACGPQPAAGQKNTLVIYSGRAESLVGPIIEQFQAASGVEVEVRWGNTAELAATMLEEGQRSPADIYFAQDPGALGAVGDLLAPLPDDLLNRVDAQFRDPSGRWIGISGRARVLAYNTRALTPEQLPADLWGLTDPSWSGKIGWAPSNASFQTMVTAMRVMWGEERTREWLQGIQANRPVSFDNNTALVSAVAAGEVEVGLTNHYYLFRFLQEEGEGFAARNHFFSSGGPESLVMVAGAGILETSDNAEDAQKFIEFLLSPVAQQYFATQTYEYPLVDGVVVHRELPPLTGLDVADVDLSGLADLPGTVVLLQEVGALP
jgi:iron(III) transport system substrate-binding protein